MKTKIVLLAPFVLAALVGCSSGAGSSATSVGTTQEALRGTVTSVDTAAHHLTLHTTTSGEVEASWKEPEVRHGTLVNLTVNKEIELRGHQGEKEFEVDTIELEPELEDDGGASSSSGGSSSGGSSSGGSSSGGTTADGGLHDSDAGSDAEVRGSDGGLDDGSASTDADVRGADSGKGKP
jgi:uncharacterized membrane protein YgcG